MPDERAYTIAIQPDDQLLTSGRTQSFSTRWIELARERGHEVRVVDAYRPDVFEQLSDCDGFLWWFAHLPSPRNFAKRLLPAVEHGMGIPVFPDWRTCWHFDDKISQSYLLQAAGFPMPRTWVFWERSDASAFCDEARYPLVIKLATGIISENVRMLDSRADAQFWIERLFRVGVLALEWPRPPRYRRAIGRLRAAANLLLTGVPPHTATVRSDLQRGYLLLQEFVPGNDFDTRVAVIGNRAFAYRRFNRPDDFRASGSGLRDADPAQIDLESVRLGLRVARHVGAQSLAVDVIRRPSDGERVLTEISYYYEGWILHEECPGHWVLVGDPDTGELRWVEGHTRPEDAIFDDFVAGLARSLRGRGVASGGVAPGNGRALAAPAAELEGR